jgi:hypothetical protein
MSERPDRLRAGRESMTQSARAKKAAASPLGGRRQGTTSDYYEHQSQSGECNVVS